ncbi:MAG TPA: chemotaxis protein CheD [Opitutaceae bacterium]
MGGSPTIASLFTQRVIIGVGDLAVSNNPQVTLSTYALGSCVGLVVYDPVVKTGGILHLMLPDSTISPEKAVAQPAMFADTGLPLFFKSLAGMKGERSRMRMFVAGGAAVLSGADTFKIGDRNLAAVKRFLVTGGGTVTGHDTGGTINRTVHLDVATGMMSLKTPAKTEQYSLA